MAGKLRLLDLSNDAIMICDLGGQIRFWNKGAEKLYGWRLDEVDGRDCHSLLQTDFGKPSEQVLAELHRDGKFDGEVVQVSRAGRRIPLHCRWVLDAGIGVVLASYTDISARKAAEAEMICERDKAITASRAKDDFLASLSHELRTPLNPVLLVASDWAENAGLPEDARQAFAIIVKHALVEARLIDDLLDLTKIAHGKLRLEPQRLDLHALLREALATLGGSFEEKSIGLTLELTPQACAVIGDPVRLQQVFWNVLKNAQKFTPVGGTVRIRTEVAAAGGEVVVTVTDSGIGMTAGELEHLFGAFFQGDHATLGGSRHFGGLGLGLAISRTLVQQHSGRFTARSDGRDRGATFSIALPLAPAEPAATPSAVSIPPRNEAAAAGPAPAPRRILLIEDHEATRNVLTALLRRRGHSIAEAASVAEALAHAERERFDLAISDANLPDGDGRDLMLKLHGRYGLDGIAITGYGTAQDMARSRNAGFAVHLTKPVTVRNLDEAMASFFAGGGDADERHAGGAPRQVLPRSGCLGD